MARAQNAQATNRRRKKVLKKARGYFGNKSRLYRFAVDAVERAEKYAYRDRRKKKTTMRQLWIVRINAAVREQGMNYSRFIAGLNAANIQMDRKQLSELAINEPEAFKVLIEKAKAANEAAKTAQAA
jgi:large subunit ribosomal protein L20